MFKYFCQSENKSVFNWTFCQLLTEKPNCMQLTRSTLALALLSGKDRIDRSACPISGEYSGILPDEPQLCAKLSSDCNNPDIMFYSVSVCGNASEVLEGKTPWKKDFTMFTSLPFSRCILCPGANVIKLFMSIICEFS